MTGTDRWAIALLLLLTVSALSGCLADGQSSEAADDRAHAATIEAVPLHTHADVGVFEMDAYIDKGAEDEVYRATVEDTKNGSLADAELYTTAVPVEHDFTFSEEGPFPKGEATGVTLSEWLAAEGAFSYSCHAGEAHVDGVFENLVPGGVYTVWAARITMADGGVMDAVDLPLGPDDGSMNTLHADEDGNGEIHLRGVDCLRPATVEDGTGEVTTLALAWHSDGKTYGPDPGPFGQATHVQLFANVDAARTPVEGG